MGKGSNNNNNSNKSIFGVSNIISDRKSSDPEVSSAEASIGNHNNLDRPFDDGGGGPTGSNSGGANEVMAVDHKSSSPSFHYLVAEAKNSSMATTNNSQPFHVFSANPHNFPGEMVPLFTNAQYTELERQAMIYKYMISSLPVPTHLLHALYINNNNNVGYWKNGVVEAGRCKRTDGKKWRCSRDVAPHHKYCERHLHRGRPRSRKPVENHTITTTTTIGASIENHKKPRLDQQTDDLLLNAINNRAMNEGALLGFTPNEGKSSILHHQDYYYYHNWEMQANYNGPMMMVGGCVDEQQNNPPPVCWGPLAEALYRNPSVSPTRDRS